MAFTSVASDCGMIMVTFVHGSWTQEFLQKTMKLAKSLFLGSVAGLAAVAGAQAADLPAKKAAAVEYVRVCSTYGAGFFYIPGTDTCLRVGGRVRAEYLYGQPAGFTDPTTGAFVRGRNQDAVGFYTR